MRFYFFSTDAIYLFINYFCFPCPRISVIFFVLQFLKLLLPSFNHCLRIYHNITVFILCSPHVLYIFSCSVSLLSQSVQLPSPFFVSNLAYKFHTHVPLPLQLPSLPYSFFLCIDLFSIFISYFVSCFLCVFLFFYAPDLPHSTTISPCLLFVSHMSLPVQFQLFFLVFPVFCLTH